MGQAFLLGLTYGVIGRRGHMSGAHRRRHLSELMRRRSMIDNPYLELHVWKHFVEDSSGRREVEEDREEVWRLTSEGQKKNRELENLLYSEDVVYGVALLKGMLLAILATACVFVWGLSVEPPARKFILEIAPLVCIVVMFWAIIRLSGSELQRWRINRAPIVAKFALADPAFLEAIRTTDHYKLDQVENLLKIYRAREAA